MLLWQHCGRATAPLIPGQKGACHSFLHFSFALGGQQWNWERHRGRLIKLSWQGASSQHSSCTPDSQGEAGAGTRHLRPHPFNPPHHSSPARCLGAEGSLAWGKGWLVISVLAQLSLTPRSSRDRPTRTDPPAPLPAANSRCAPPERFTRWQQGVRAHLQVEMKSNPHLKGCSHFIDVGM